MRDKGCKSLQGKDQRSTGPESCTGYRKAISEALTRKCRLGIGPCVLLNTHSYHHNIHIDISREQFLYELHDPILGNA